MSKYVAQTNHVWSGFNLYGNLKFWNSLPADIQAIVQRNVTKFVKEQRDNVRKVNRELEARLASRGMIFNAVDNAGFRRHLGAGFYQRWKTEFGPTAWSLLEAEVGKPA